MTAKDNRTPAVAAAVESMVQSAIGKHGSTMIEGVEYVPVRRDALQLLLSVNARRESLADKVFRSPDVMPNLHPEQR